MLKVSVIEKGRTAEAVPEGQPVTKHKLLAEEEATEVLDHLAHDWPQHLYDGAVIDHILKVINIPRTDRTEISGATASAVPPPIWPRARPLVVLLSAPFKVMLAITP